MPTHYKGGDDEIRALNAYINLLRAADSVYARISAQLEAQGVTVGQFGVLEALLHLGPMCQRALGEKLLRTGGNITMVVDNLEKREWVRRERQEADRRMVVIHLTPQGRKVISRIFPQHVASVSEIFSLLNPAEQEELRRLARTLGRGAENRKDRKKEGVKEHDPDSTS